MADPEHVARLRGGAVQWNVWRAANPEIRPDLSGVTIEGERLQGINLSDGNMRDSKFISCLFTEADLSNADLRRIDLQNSHLKNARLNRAELSHVGAQVDFAGAIFHRARLVGCNLKEANLFMADLSEATIIGTSFTRAVLRKVRMKDSLLQSCGFYEAFLVDVSLAGARMDQCVFSGTTVAGVDLAEVAGLETCHHEGPSHAAGALELTAAGVRRRPYMQGSIEAFLRGSGIPDEYLNTFRDTVYKPIEFYSCFISYSHLDAEFARRLHNDLQMAGIRCWLDEHAMRPGDDIYAEVDKGIRLWDKVLLCCSRHSLSSWWVERELDPQSRKR